MSQHQPSRRHLLQSTVSLAALSGLAGVSLGNTGCIGSFGLTRTVYELNRGMGPLIVQEVVFLAFCIVPVYEVALFIDVILLNTIEALTGEPVLAGRASGSRQVELAQGTDFFVVPEEDAVETELIEAHGRRTLRRFERRAHGLEITDEEGAVVARASLDPEGGLLVEDIYGAELARVPVSRLSEAVAAFERDGASGLAALVMDELEV